MVKYTCERCFKEFSQKSHYDSHKRRKNPCEDQSSKLEALVSKALEKKLNELENKIETTPKIRIVDLFAGTGAFSLAFEEYGIFRCLFSNDMVKSSKLIYDLNHSTCSLTLKDLHDVGVDEIPRHDILCSGSPCQPFSIAGKQLGFADKRSNTFWKVFEILKHHQPPVIIIENVKNLKTHDKGNTYKIIANELEKLGYMIKATIIDTSKVTDIPQHRERIFIVGFRNEEMFHKFNFDFPPVKNRKIKEFLESDVPDKYYYSKRFKVYSEIEKSVKKHIDSNTLYQYRRYYVRENKSDCCPTLTANMGKGGHNVPLLKDDKGIRKLTPRECFNLQGFPRDYKLPEVCDSQLYKLAGNAVSVPVIRLIVGKLSKLF